MILKKILMWFPRQLFFSDFTRTPPGADFRQKIILDGDEHRQLIKKLVTKMMKKQL
jgi:hypothetical protein